MKPKRYEILRGVLNGRHPPIALSERPVQVWTMLNELMFDQIGLKHWDSAFIEDSMHDWDWREGSFRFYGHSGERGTPHDLIVIYEK